MQRQRRSSEARAATPQDQQRFHIAFAGAMPGMRG
jgi:hypothetical protein